MKGALCMFGSSKKNSNESIRVDIETIIGRNTQFKGVIGGGGSIRVDGNLEGEISVDGDIVVGEQGEVIAEIKACNILVSGLVRGNVSASNKLEILSTGRLYGDVRAAVLSINEGALFKGNSSMEPENENRTELD